MPLFTPRIQNTATFQQDVFSDKQDDFREEKHGQVKKLWCLKRFALNLTHIPQL